MAAMTRCLRRPRPPVVYQNNLSSVSIFLALCTIHINKYFYVFFTYNGKDKKSLCGDPLVRTRRAKYFENLYDIWWPTTWQGIDIDIDVLLLRLQRNKTKNSSASRALVPGNEL